MEKGQCPIQTLKKTSKKWSFNCDFSLNLNWGNIFHIIDRIKDSRVPLWIRHCQLCIESLLKLRLQSIPPWNFHKLQNHHLQLKERKKTTIPSLFIGYRCTLYIYWFSWMRWCGGRTGTGTGLWACPSSLPWCLKLLGNRYSVPMWIGHCHLFMQGELKLQCISQIGLGRCPECELPSLRWSNQVLIS